MAFRDNSALISTAARVDVEADGEAGTFTQAADGATAFVIADGAVGDDTFLGFGNDDSLIAGRRIFDGNGDGFIQFGPNGVLDVDRSSRTNPGEDQLQLVGTGDDAITEIRFLGSKGGQFVYADSSTLRNLAGAFGDTNLQNDAGNSVVEGTVGDDTINAGDGAKVILQDNALGLNLGGDTITGFGDDDLLVTTAQLFDSEGDGDIEFYTNEVLDVSGAEGPNSSDPRNGPGGQLDFNDSDLQSLDYLGSNVINGVTYYYYGTEGSTFDPTTGD